jgi:hypothetical protein
MLLYFIPTILLVIIFIIAALVIKYKSGQDPQDLVSQSCLTIGPIGETVSVVSVTFGNGEMKTLALSTYCGTVDSKTKVLIVGYIPATQSYKVEVFE